MKNEPLFEADQPVLDRLSAATKAIHDLEIAQRQLVHEARYEGLTWDFIADALGITKQGAQQRYGATRKSYS